MATSMQEWNLHSWISPHVAKVIEGDLGLCAGHATIKNVSSSAHPSKDNSEPNDTLTIAIPYAGMTLQWQVLLDGFNPDELPDFLIPNHDGFDPDYEDLPYLREWNHNDPQKLFKIFKDLLSLYKKHHSKLLTNLEGKFPKDIIALINSEQYRVNVCVVQEETERYNVLTNTISMLIRIELDFSEIPSICFKDAPSEDPSYVHPVLFVRTFENGKIVPQLFIPPRLEHALGGRNSMKLPAYSRQSTDLSDYVQTVRKQLYELIVTLRDGHSKRREYVAAFLCQCSENVLEYDAEDFCKISLLFSYEDFYFIVHVTLGRLYPHEQPKLTFQSVYHVTKKGSLYQVSHSNYPYSPRWTGSEMIKRTRTYILDQIEAFRAGCLKNGIL